MVHKNEFVFPASVVKAIGVDKLYAAMHSFKLPKLPVAGYANGGLVGGGGSSANLQPINLNIAGQNFQVMSDADVASALVNYLNTEGGL